MPPWCICDRTPASVRSGGDPIGVQRAPKTSHGRTGAPGQGKGRHQPGGARRATRSASREAALLASGSALSGHLCPLEGRERVSSLQGRCRSTRRWWPGISRCWGTSPKRRGRGRDSEARSGVQAGAPPRRRKETGGATQRVPACAGEGLRRQAGAGPGRVTYPRTWEGPLWSDHALRVQGPCPRAAAPHPGHLCRSWTGAFVAPAAAGTMLEHLP